MQTRSFQHSTILLSFQLTATCENFNLIQFIFTIAIYAESNELQNADTLKMLPPLFIFIMKLFHFIRIIPL